MRQLCTNSFRNILKGCLSLSIGASALIIPPDPVFPCDLEDANSLHRRDMTLDELHQNILRFIYAYAPGAESYITEEWDL